MAMQINKQKHLTPLELIRLRSILAKHDNRDTLILELLLATGARATEMLNVTLADIDEADQTVFIRGIKNSDNREIPLKPELFSRLIKYCNGLGKIDLNLPIFPISYSRLNQIWDTYRPVKKKLHSLRHTFAIRVWEKNKDIQICKKFLGHKSILNTMVYADYCYNKEQFRNAIPD